MPQKFSIELLSSQLLTPTIVKLVFKPRGPGPRPAFEPGQYVEIELGPGLVRPFALASAPESEELEFCVRVGALNSLSEVILGLKPGTVLGASEPKGRGFYQHPEGKRDYFIALGTAAAAFRSLVLSRLYAETPRKGALLLVGDRNEDELAWLVDFTTAGVEVIPVLTQPSLNWKGFTGRTSAYLRLLEDVPADAHFYICGSPEMMRESEEILRSRGVPSTRIRRLG